MPEAGWAAKNLAATRESAKRGFATCTRTLPDDLIASEYSTDRSHKIAYAPERSANCCLFPFWLPIQSRVSPSTVSTGLRCRTEMFSTAP